MMVQKNEKGMKNWVKLQRKLYYHQIFQNRNLLQLFIYCLIRANHKENEIPVNNDRVKVKPRSFIAGRKKISKRIKMNESAVYQGLKRLEKLGIISIKSNNKYSVITFLYSDICPPDNFKSEQHKSKKDENCEQQVNTDKTVLENAIDKDEDHIEFPAGFSKWAKEEKGIFSSDLHLIEPKSQKLLIEEFNKRHKKSSQ